MAPSDETLLTQYKAGDEDAFRTLVDRYTPPIYNLALNFLRDAMEAENVTQETFLRVVSALDRVRLDLPIKPYLFRIAVNLCRDLARKKHPMLFTDLDAGASQTGYPEMVASEMIADDAPPLWERVEAQEQSALLSSLIDQLPLIYRTAILLRYVEEFSYGEIAQTLDLPINTVRTHLRRAKDQLRLKLEEERGTAPSPD
jgi:RNA polymerase sigma factor, sigma-70 family